MTGRIIKAGAVDHNRLERHPERQRALDELTQAQLIKHRALGKLREQIIDLSATMARQIIGQSVKLHPELLDQIYRQALGALGKLATGPGTLTISAADQRPELDALASRTGFKIKTSDDLSLGGCRVEVDGLEIDATIETALATLTRALKENSDE